MTHIHTLVASKNLISYLSIYRLCTILLQRTLVQIFLGKNIKGQINLRYCKFYHTTHVHCTRISGAAISISICPAVDPGGRRPRPPLPPIFEAPHYILWPKLHIFWMDQICPPPFGQILDPFLLSMLIESLCLESVY